VRPPFVLDYLEKDSFDLLAVGVAAFWDRPAPARLVQRQGLFVKQLDVRGEEYHRLRLEPDGPLETG
jgi:hypothetical protein